MGCTSEKCIPESNFNKNKKGSNIITDDNFEIDLHDIEKQGESKHQKIEININNEDIQPEDNYYNYDLKDLTLVNNSKMIVKRIENFDDDDDDESESEEDKEDNSDHIEDNNNNNEYNENKIEEEKLEQDKNINFKEEKDNKEFITEEDIEKKPEDKKPPNIEKLRKKGKDKKEIKIF